MDPEVPPSTPRAALWGCGWRLGQCAYVDKRYDVALEYLEPIKRIESAEDAAAADESKHQCHPAEAEQTLHAMRLLRVRNERMGEEVAAQGEGGGGSGRDVEESNGIARAKQVLGALAVGVEGRCKALDPGRDARTVCRTKNA